MVTRDDPAMAAAARGCAARGSRPGRAASGPGSGRTLRITNLRRPDRASRRPSGSTGLVARPPANRGRPTASGLPASPGLAIPPDVPGLECGIGCSGCWAARSSASARRAAGVARRAARHRDAAVLPAAAHPAGLSARSNRRAAPARSPSGSAPRGSTCPSGSGRSRQGDDRARGDRRSAGQCAGQDPAPLAETRYSRRLRACAAAWSAPDVSLGGAQAGRASSSSISRLARLRVRARPGSACSPVPPPRARRARLNCSSLRERARHQQCRLAACEDLPGRVVAGHRDDHPGARHQVVQVRS